MDGIALLEYFLWGVVVVLISLIARRMFSSSTSGAHTASSSQPVPEVKRGPIHLTLAELSKYDGKDPSLPLYMAVKVRFATWRRNFGDGKTLLPGLLCDFPPF